MYEDMWKRDYSAQRKEDAELFIKEAFASPKASDSFGKVHSKAFRGNKKKVVTDNPKTLKRIGQVGLVGLGAVGAGLAYKKYKDSKNNEKTAASASTIRNRIIGGSAALGALGLGTHEALKSRVLPSGVTQREAEVEARRAQDARYEELTQKKRNKLVRAGEARLEALGQRMDENKGVAIPAKALAGAAIGGYASKKALDFVKRNARYI